MCVIAKKCVCVGGVYVREGCVYVQVCEREGVYEREGVCERGGGGIPQGLFSDLDLLII